MHRGVVPHAVVRVHDPGLGRIRDDAAAEEVSRERDVGDLAPRAPGQAADLLGDLPGGLVAGGDPGGVGLAVTLLAGDVPERTEALDVGLQRVVQVLHHERDHRTLAPAAQVEQLHEHGRLAPDLVQQSAPPRERPVAVRQQGLQDGDGVGALAVPDRFDVGVGAGMERRRDGHTLGEVLLRLVVRAHRPEDRLGIGASEPTDRIRQLGKGPGVLGVVEQVLGSPGAGRHDDLTGGHRGGALAATRPGARPLEGDLPRAVAALAQVADRGPVQDAGARALGQGEVVLHQRVLGVVPAAGHALAALDARVAVRPHPAEVRIRDQLAGLAPPAGLLAEEHADRGVDEGVLHAHVSGDLLHDLIRVGVRGVGDHAQHAAALVVERGELFLPVRDVAPLPVPEELARGLVQRVGVVERSPADARAGEDHHVAHHVDALDPEQFELGRPYVAVESPGRLGQVGVLEAATRLDHRDAVPLLRQSQGRHAAAETGADDDDIRVRRRGGGVGRGRRCVRRHGATPRGGRWWASQYPSTLELTRQ